MFEKTLISDENFKLFQKLLDKNSVYLELSNIEFEATLGKVTVQIPLDIWEVIRRIQIVQIDLINKTDSEIREMVEMEVNNRINHYFLAKKKSKFHFPKNDPIYGKVTNSREEQLKRGIQYYFEKREQHQKLMERIVQHLNNLSSQPDNELNSVVGNKTQSYILDV